MKTQLRAVLCCKKVQKIQFSYCLLQQHKSHDFYYSVFIIKKSTQVQSAAECSRPADCVSGTSIFSSKKNNELRYSLLQTAVVEEYLGLQRLFIFENPLRYSLLQSAAEQLTTATTEDCLGLHRFFFKKKPTQVQFSADCSSSSRQKQENQIYVWPNSEMIFLNG